MEVTIKESPGHFAEWVAAIMSNFPDYAGPLAETILLGNLAVSANGKKIEWDAKNLRATNAPEVMRVVKREYRSGWSLGQLADSAGAGRQKVQTKQNLQTCASVYNVGAGSFQSRR